jgi:tetratricopeptide (TPR) repeat protein
MPGMEGGAQPAAILTAGIDALLHGRLDEAVTCAGEAIAAATVAMVARSGHGPVDTRDLVVLRARAHALAGRAHLERFSFAEARAELNAARHDWRHCPEADPLGAAATEAALASLFWLCDDPDSAVGAARSALAALPASPSLTERQDAAHLVCHLAFVDIPGRAPPEIRDQLLTAVSVLEAIPSAHPLEVANVRFVLAMIEQRLGHHREAAELFDHVRRTRADVLGEDHHYVAYATHGEAQTALDLGDLTASVRLADEALGVLTRRLGPEHPNVTTILLTRGMAVLLGDRPDRTELALRDFQDGLRVSQAHFGRESPQNATAWLMLGVAHYAAADAAPAEEALRHALQLGLTYPRTRGDVAVTALRHLAEIWRLDGRLGEVVRATTYAVEVWTRHPSLSAETAVKWALQGSEAALTLDDPEAAALLLETAWEGTAHAETLGEGLRGALVRSRAAVAELGGRAAPVSPPDDDENGSGEPN